MRYIDREGEIYWIIISEIFYRNYKPGPKDEDFIF